MKFTLSVCEIRFVFRLTVRRSKLWAADVGQNAIEEVDNDHARRKLRLARL